MRRSTWLTDQDVAFAIAQWCSGVTQKEIGKHFGHASGSSVSNGIERFIRKYYAAAPVVPDDRWPCGSGSGRVDAHGEKRQMYAHIAFCHFMAQREEHAP